MLDSTTNHMPWVVKVQTPLVELTKPTIATPDQFTLHSRPMSNITELSITQLKKAVVLKEKLAKLEKELASLLGTSASTSGPKKKGGMSAAGRARIVAAQKKRWAKIKAAQKAKN